MARSKNIAPFFNLPLELREQIYKEVLTSPSQGPELLRACRVINTEAQKFLYQRPIKFPGELYMYGWLDSIPEKFHSQVTEISLNIRNVDLRSLLDSNTSASHQSPPDRLLAWELYIEELRNLKIALSKLSRVRTMTIQVLPGRQSHLYRDFLNAILNSLHSKFPVMLGLRLEGNLHYQSLEFLRMLPALQSLTFDGFSANSATEMSDILGSLEHLGSLTLISHHAMLTPSNLPHSGCKGKFQLFADNAMHTIERLAALSVRERAPEPFTNLFFTPEVATAMQRHKSLTSLSISLSYTPNDEMLRSLGRCLGSSAIQRLVLDWPGLHPEMLEEHSLVGRCIKTLWIRVKSTDAAIKLLSYLLEHRRSGDLNGLEELVLVRDLKDYNATDTAMYDRKDSACIIGEEGSEVVSSSVSSSSKKHIIIPHVVFERSTSDSHWLT
jgi:hypothetical protein